MTELETTQPIPENQHDSPVTDAETAVLDTEAEPPPEPWTPERVIEWNAYYDLYVKLAALLLVFMVSCNYVSDSQVWLHLKSGQLIAEQRWPIKTDVLSYTEYQRPWIDIHWLFQWVNATIYKLVNELVPVNPADPTANRASAEQIAVGSLVVVSAALVRLATAWLLLLIRRPGPGVWWLSLVITFCLGTMYHPLSGLNMGGLAGVAGISPKTWGLLLFSFEMYILFRAFSQGRGRALWLLIPTFVLWANLNPLLPHRPAGAGRGGHWLLARCQERYQVAGSSGKAGRESRRVCRRDHVRIGSATAGVRVRYPRDLRGGLPRESVYVSGLRGRGVPLFPHFRARDENHDDRPAFVLRPMGPRAHRARLVLPAGFLYHHGAHWACVVLLEQATVFLGPLPAIRGRVGHLGNLHGRQRDVRGRLRRGRRAQRPGVVSRSSRHRRPARMGVDGLVNGWSSAHSRLDLPHDRHRYHRLEKFTP